MVAIETEFVLGLKDNHLKKKLLKEDPEKLTLDEVIKCCQMSETADDRFKNNGFNINASADIHKTKARNTTMR